MVRGDAVAGSRSRPRRRSWLPRRRRSIPSTGTPRGEFHERFLRDKALAIACPKLDDGQDQYLSKRSCYRSRAKYSRRSGCSRSGRRAHAVFHSRHMPHHPAAAISGAVIMPGKYPYGSGVRSGKMKCQTHKTGGKHDRDERRDRQTAESHYGRCENKSERDTRGSFPIRYVY